MLWKVERTATTTGWQPIHVFIEALMFSKPLAFDDRKVNLWKTCNFFLLFPLGDPTKSKSFGIRAFLLKTYGDPPSTTLDNVCDRMQKKKNRTSLARCKMTKTRRRGCPQRDISVRIWDTVLLPPCLAERGPSQDFLRTLWANAAKRINVVTVFVFKNDRLLLVILNNFDPQTSFLST